MWQNIKTYGQVSFEPKYEFLQAPPQTGSIIFWLAIAQSKPNSELMNKSLSKQNSSGKNNSAIQGLGDRNRVKNQIRLSWMFRDCWELCYVHGKILTDLSCH